MASFILGNGHAAPQRCPQPRSQFLVGRDADGRWVVRDEFGLRGGVFVSKAAAVHFACFETDHQPNVVLFLPEHIKLSLTGAVPAH